MVIEPSLPKQDDGLVLERLGDWIEKKALVIIITVIDPKA
jgi:hypothetical protein